MRGLLLDSKFMTILNRIGELVILNICYLVCCIPIVTVGAAITGLYTVCFRFGTARERGALGSFFRAFLANLKQGILLWLIGLAVGLFSAYFALLFFTMGGVIHYAFIPFLVLLALCLVVFSYAFPLLSQFENTVAQTLKNAAILSLGAMFASAAEVTEAAADTCSTKAFLTGVRSTVRVSMPKQSATSLPSIASIS